MTQFTLIDLGWSDRFQAQLAEDDGPPARISSVARDRLEAFTANGQATLVLTGGDTTGAYTVGDWVTYDPATGRTLRRLDRSTLLQRRAAGSDARQQLIAANVDTLGIVTSCNSDFKEARLERYIALASTAGCLPLIVITRADEAEQPDGYRRRAEALSPMVAALAVNAHDPDEIDRLSPWCNRGQTLALVGSSGVGKTTLSNGLTGRGDATRGIREDDSKGRHTTTSRALWRTSAGGWLIDTPGMRALRLTDSAEGIDTLFSDLSDLAKLCRFSDCQHHGEPGCAIQAEIDAGRLDPARRRRWEKLLREDARNSETLAESRARDRALSKLYSQGRARSRHKRGL